MNIRAVLCSIYGAGRVASEQKLTTMRLEKRIRALEARMIADPVILHFADGSTEEIRGPGDFLLSFFAGAFGGVELSPAQTAQLQLIRQSVDAEEPGGGSMVELLRALLNSPSEV
jgi:hypothetical protein